MAEHLSRQPAGEPLAVAVVYRHAPSEAPLHAPKADWLLEAGLLGSAVLVVLLGLSLTASGRLAWLSLVAVSVPLIYGWSRLRTSTTMIKLIRTPEIGCSLAALALAATAAAALQLLAPFYLVRVLDASAATVGFTVLAFPVAIAVMG
jgi:DHA2 family multidrug resistance protein-like MFS transporter